MTHQEAKILIPNDNLFLQAMWLKQGGWVMVIKDDLWKLCKWVEVYQFSVCVMGWWCLDALKRGWGNYRGR